MKMFRLIFILLLGLNSLKLSAQFKENDIKEILMFNLEETVKKLIINKKNITHKETLNNSVLIDFHDKSQKNIYDTFRLHAFVPVNINDTIFEGKNFVAFRFLEEYFINTKDRKDSFSTYTYSKGASFLSTYLVSYHYSDATYQYYVIAYSGSMLKHNIWDKFYKNKDLTIETITSYLKLRCYSLLIKDIQFESRNNNIYTFNLQLEYEKVGKWQLKFDVNDPNNPILYVDDEQFRGEW